MAFQSRFGLKSRGMTLARAVSAMDHESTTPQVPTAAAEPGAPPVTGADATPVQGGFGLREFLLVGLALVGGLFITFALLMGRGVPTHAAASANGVADGPALREVKSAPKPQQWSDARRDVWLGARRKGVAFDLTSNENVSAWMKNVRPVLVVRCMAGSMEAFVVTETAAQIEPRTDTHTVMFQFDDQAPVTERWPDSSEHDALFAPGRRCLCGTRRRRAGHELPLHAAQRGRRDRGVPGRGPRGASRTGREAL